MGFLYFEKNAVGWKLVWDGMKRAICGESSVMEEEGSV
jgi:hypothetical protein